MYIELAYYFYASVYIRIDNKIIFIVARKVYYY